MAKKTIKQELRAFLREREKEKARLNCGICQGSKEIQEAIVIFLDDKASGDTHISTNDFCENFLVGRKNGPSRTAVRKHIKRCLKRCGTTGRALNEKEK